MPSLIQGHLLRTTQVHAALLELNSQLFSLWISKNNVKEGHCEFCSTALLAISQCVTPLENNVIPMIRYIRYI